MVFPIQTVKNKNNFCELAFDCCFFLVEKGWLLDEFFSIEDWLKDVSFKVIFPFDVFECTSA